MVSRRTRSYKDKKPAGIFGQFMLPLAVIMAIALLYFSIKLFFLNSGGQKNREVAGAPAAISADAPPAAQVIPEKPPSEQKEPVKIIAGPVGSQTTPPATTANPPAPAAAKPPAATAKPPAAQTQTPAAAAKPPAATATTKPAETRRYDVQIGAFSARDNAVQLVQKVRSQGYEVYVNEPETAPPPYRVRVKGTADRQQTEALSAKLKEQGYPTYIVTIN